MFVYTAEIIMDGYQRQKVSNLIYNQYNVSRLPVKLCKVFLTPTYCVSVSVNLKRCTLTLFQEFCF